MNHYYEIVVSVFGYYKKNSTTKVRQLKLHEKERLTAKVLIQDKSTRWNSEYLMLLYVLCELKLFISANCMNTKIDNKTNEQYFTIGSLLYVLKQLYYKTMNSLNDWEYYFEKSNKLQQNNIKNEGSNIYFEGGYYYIYSLPISLYLV